jgi:Rrf2 family protein
VVNQQFTFAVHILAALAFAGEIVDSRTLAASVNTNPVVVRRLLLALRRAGLIRTFPGKHGGALLRRKPERITLLDVYQAVEPRPVVAVNERKPFRHCPVSCHIKPIMNRVAENAERAVRRQLRTITLKEIVRQIPADERGFRSAAV